MFSQDKKINKIMYKHFIHINEILPQLNNVKSKFFLHNVVPYTNKYPELEEIIEFYLKTDKGKKEIDLKKKGLTPLMIAIQNINCSLKTIQILIDANANINLQNDYEHNYTALMYTLKVINLDRSIEIMKMLISKNVDLTLQTFNNLNALMLILESKDPNKFKKMKLLTDINVNLQNDLGKTALMHACRLNLLPEVKFLIEENANLDLQDNYGNTALILTFGNNLEIIKLLINANANLNLQNKNGDTLLMFLCDRIVDINDKNSYYFQSGNYVTQCYSNYCDMHNLNITKIIKLLIENNYDLNLQNIKGYSGYLYLLKNKELASYYLEYYKNMDKDILIKFITEHYIPNENYNMLIKFITEHYIPNENYNMLINYKYFL